jgi:hypothetical protein
MMSGLLRGTVLVIVVAMLAGQASELFDRWDHPLRTGRETAYPMVMAAACAGLALLLAKKLASVFPCLRAGDASLAEESFPTLGAILPEICAAGPSPPHPPSLRI